MKTLKTLKREMLADTETRTAYNAQADEYAIARELIAARSRAGLLQSEVAQRMGTTQSVVARLESGKRLALKAQGQYRSTIEAIAEIKNPRAVAFVKQANIAHGPQQVNNGVVAGESHAHGNIQNQSNELSGAGHERLPDPKHRKHKAELIRQWKPWEKSSGPRTEAGKANSAGNSRKHGNRSREVLDELLGLREYLRGCTELVA